VPLQGIPERPSGHSSGSVSGRGDELADESSVPLAVALVEGVEGGVTVEDLVWLTVQEAEVLAVTLDEPEGEPMGLSEALEVAETEPVELMVALMVALMEDVDVIVLVMLEVADIVLVIDGVMDDDISLIIMDEVGDIVPVIEDVMVMVPDGELRRAQTRPLPPMLERVETVPAGQLPDSTQRPEPAANKCAVVGSRKLGNNAQPSLHERQSNCPPAGPHS